MFRYISALVLFALLVVACGSSDDTTNPTSAERSAAPSANDTPTEEGRVPSIDTSAPSENPTETTQVEGRPRLDGEDILARVARTESGLYELIQPASDDAISLYGVYKPPIDSGEEVRLVFSDHPRGGEAFAQLHCVLPEGDGLPDCRDGDDLDVRPLSVQGTEELPSSLAIPFVTSSGEVRLWSACSSGEVDCAREVGVAPRKAAAFDSEFLVWYDRSRDAMLGCHLNDCAGTVGELPNVEYLYYRDESFALEAGVLYWPEEGEQGPTVQQCELSVSGNEWSCEPEPFHVALDRDTELQIASDNGQIAIYDPGLERATVCSAALGCDDPTLVVEDFGVTFNEYGDGSHNMWFDAAAPEEGCVAVMFIMPDRYDLPPSAAVMAGSGCDVVFPGDDPGRLEYHRWDVDLTDDWLHGDRFEAGRWQAVHLVGGWVWSFNNNYDETKSLNLSVCRAGTDCSTY